MSSIFITPEEVHALSGRKIMLIDIRGRMSGGGNIWLMPAHYRWSRSSPAVLIKTRWRKPTW